MTPLDLDLVEVGVTPLEPRDVALNRACRSLIADDATAHPFHWAGFVLSGAAGPLSVDPKR